MIGIVFTVSSDKDSVGVGRPGVIVAMVAKYLLTRASGDSTLASSYTKIKRQLIMRTGE